MQIVKSIGLIILLIFPFVFSFSDRSFHWPLQNGLNENIIGGVIVAIMLGIVKLSSPKIHITGQWDVEEELLSSTETIDPVKKINFLFDIQQKDKEIVGRLEKISEISIADEERIFDRAKRVHGEFTGAINYSMFSKPKISISVLEHGRQRDSNTAFNLTYLGKHLIKGDFSSTAADANGNVIFRKKFPL